ncbi:hypothetical protein M2272_004426 [Mycobacterium frederiksbergense]|uniref:PucR C-terminal helix-turn-helix domain-containing protein n=1 Tax=Mycolicibacterium frederiksbergense TaxID=117567 RepID=A0ABT6L609_9MYCO|nr:helix-turn-helix domain-containing protein [Mycolicibacterium frederiksbergense]MDH6197770.1 hypothetical protein [Mycolicibacterium frederiksbergense]
MSLDFESGTNPLDIESQMTVGAVIDRVDARALHLANPDADVSRPVREVVLCDPDEPLPAVSDAVVLLIGARTRYAELPSRLVEAHRYGYAAVVVKLEEELTSTILRGLDPDTATLPVLVASHYVSWRDVDVLFTSLLAASGLDSGGAGREHAVNPVFGVSDAVERASDNLFALCNALAALIGGSVVVESLEQHILAYSSIPGQRIDESRQECILQRQVPDLPYHREQYMKVLMSPTPVRFDARNGELPRLAAAIRSGRMPLGTVWAIEGPRPFTDEQEDKLAEAAQIAALQILRSASTGEVDSRIRASALIDALQSPLVTAKVKEELGLDSNVTATLGALSTIGTASRSASAVDQIAIEIRRYLSAFRPGATSAVLNNTIYVLSLDSPLATRRLIENMLQQLRHRFDVEVVAAVSDTIDDSSTFAHALQQVGTVLRVLRNGAPTPDAKGAPRVADLRDVQLAVMIDRLRDFQQQEPLLVNPSYARLTAHDSEHHTEYAESLRVWCESMFDIATAGRLLGIHANSLRYRLRRLEEIAGVSLTNAEDVLALWLQATVDHRRPAPRTESDA